MPPEGSNSHKRSSSTLRRSGPAWGVVLLAILVTSLIRVHLLDVPLERDEGEYAYMAQLLLKGLPPYGAAYTMKFPGIYAAYALVMLVFGQTHTGVHLGLLVVNAATVVLVFLIARRLYGPWPSAAAAACFSVLSVSKTVQGMMAHPEHFVMLFALGGLLLLLGYLEDEGSGKANVFLSGLLLGSSVLMKQHGAAFVLFAFLYLAATLLKRGGSTRPVASSIVLFSAGVAVPFAVTLALLVHSGVFEKFWFWTFEYPRAYTSLLGPSEALYVFWFRAVRILASMLPAAVLAALGLAAVVWDGEVRKKAFFLVAFTLFSFISMIPGLHFWPHYFVLVLPAVSLLLGAALSALHALLSRTGKASIGALPCLAIALFAIAYPVYAERDILLFDTPVMVSRKIYGFNPFPEAIEVSRYIRENSGPEDRVAVIGSEPEIYFYSGRVAATGYVYVYPLMENHRYAPQMTEEMIREVESSRPLFLVLVNFRASWLTTEGYSERKDLIFAWFERFSRGYERVGLAEVVSPFETDYYWDELTPQGEPRYKYWIAVYKRRPTG